MNPSSPAAIAPTARLPQILRERAECAWQDWLEAAGETIPLREMQLIQRHPAELSRWLYAWALSPWSAEQCRRQPGCLWELSRSGALHRASGPRDFRARWAHPELEHQDELWRALRRFRNREMLRLIWRDLNRLAHTRDTCRELSLLAETCLEIALEWHYADACQHWGTPCTGDGTAQRMIVLGMGKLGGRELNLSSDIDLVFAYPESGVTRPVQGALQLSNQEFFERLGQALIASLHTLTEDGFVFRVDMRLRPNGDSGPLVASFASMETYYERQGREWERYALLKARPVAGDRRAGESLLQGLRPFVYRRHLDFSAIDELRQMQQNIATQLSGREAVLDLKRGAGGIRRIEFIVQSLQLVFGGRSPALQTPGLFEGLRALAAEGRLPLRDLHVLRRAYLFLRDVEHALQAYADRQTQQLPEEELQRAALAAAMGFCDWSHFSASLEAHRRLVEQHFRQMTRGGQRPAAQWQRLWTGQLPPAEARTLLQEAGFSDPAACLERLAALRDGTPVRTLSAVGHRRVDEFMALLLAALHGQSNPDTALQRTLLLVEQVLGRHVYLAMLNENPPALRQLLQLCGGSARIARQLAALPMLLDELLDPRTLYAPLQKDELRCALRAQCTADGGRTAEDFLETLRHFKNTHSLHVAAQHLLGALGPREVGARLSWIAEALLRQTLGRCRRELSARHGAPCSNSRDGGAVDFIIVAYGRLGSEELGYDSDLDLVFLYDAEPEVQTRGQRPLSNALFFTRLTQRIISCLGARTASGRAYEVDTRLRPSGNSGLLVSNFDAFAQYQEHRAWTWEHLALVRARAVAGPARLAARFARLRRTVLCGERASETLSEDVLQMYDRIRKHHTAADYPAELKRGDGGMADIEMMVQYAVLRHAHRTPQLARYTDAEQLLQCLERHALLPAGMAPRLGAAYSALKEELGRFELLGEAAPGPSRQARAEVQACREQLFS